MYACVCGPLKMEGWNTYQNGKLMKGLASLFIATNLILEHGIVVQLVHKGLIDTVLPQETQIVLLVLLELCREFRSVEERCYGLNF